MDVGVGVVTSVGVVGGGRDHYTPEINRRREGRKAELTSHAQLHITPVTLRPCVSIHTRVLPAPVSF